MAGLLGCCCPSEPCFYDVIPAGPYTLNLTDTVTASSTFSPTFPPSNHLGGFARTYLISPRERYKRITIRATIHGITTATAISTVNVSLSINTVHPQVISPPFFIANCNSSYNQQFDTVGSQTTLVEVHRFPVPPFSGSAPSLATLNGVYEFTWFRPGDPQPATVYQNFQLGAKTPHVTNPGRNVTYRYAPRGAVLPPFIERCFWEIRFQVSYNALFSSFESMTTNFSIYAHCEE